MSSPAQPLRILASWEGRSQIEAGVAHCLNSRPFQFVLPQALDLNAGGCDLAFVSRDVTGSSTKHDVKPATQAFYDALLASHALRWVHIHSAGVDRPVYVQLQSRAVRVTPSAGANAAVVAQVALAGLLALSRRLPLLMQAQRMHAWQPLHGDLLPRDLAGQRMTIIGWGGIGQTLARYAQMLGLQVRVARHSGAAVDGLKSTVSYAQLQTLLPDTDWLVLACPLTEQTRGLLQAAHLAALPKGAHLINVSRGEVVHEPALIAALQSGHLAGAYLDVFAQEPLPAASPLWDMPQVILTPHCAGFSDGNAQRVAQMFLDQLRSHISAGLFETALP